MSNENDKKSSLEQLEIIIRGIADIIKAIGSSSQSLTTIAIAISFSVTLSTVTIVYVPQVQKAIRGPQGEQGLQGIQGDPGLQGIQGPPGFGAPDYDSGWIAIGAGQTLEICTLDNRSVFVYMLGKTTYGDILQKFYGTDTYYNDLAEATWHMGAYWWLYPDNDLMVRREVNDWAYVEVRVRVWYLP